MQLEMKDRWMSRKDVDKDTWCTRMERWTWTSSTQVNSQCPGVPVTPALEDRDGWILGVHWLASLASIWGRREGRGDIIDSAIKKMRYLWLHQVICNPRYKRKSHKILLSENSTHVNQRLNTVNVIFQKLGKFKTTQNKNLHVTFKSTLTILPEGGDSPAVEREDRRTCSWRSLWVGY